MNTHKINLIKDLNRNLEKYKAIKFQRHTVNSIDSEEILLKDLNTSTVKINIISTTGRYIELQTYYFEAMERFEDERKILYSYWLDGALYTISMNKAV